MNLLLVFFSVFAVNFAAAEASAKSIQAVNDDEEEVGSPCLGICTAIFIGLVSAAGAVAANPIGQAAIGGVIVYGLTEGYSWYRQGPKYHMIDEGKVCATGMQITSFDECQEALAQSSVKSTTGIVHNLHKEKNKKEMPKGCFVLAPNKWSDPKTVSVGWNENGNPDKGAMEAQHANAICKKTGTAEEMEAEVAEYQRRQAAAEAEVAASAMFKGEHDILNKILFMFIGASLCYGALYFMRKDGARLLADYDAL